MAAQWLVNGNTGTDPASDFLGTIDSKPLVIRTTNLERLRVNADNGYLGIGTPIPDRSLTIASQNPPTYTNVKSSSGEILMGIDQGGGMLSVMSNDDLSLRAGGNNEKMRITAGGYVGIGTPKPDQLLTVARENLPNYVKVKGSAWSVSREVMLGVDLDYTSSAFRMMSVLKSSDDLDVEAGGNIRLTPSAQFGCVAIGNPPTPDLAKLVVRGDFDAIRGYSKYSEGVRGSGKTGVSGSGSIGVNGTSNAEGGAGVHGLGSIGVKGESFVQNGIGVYGGSYYGGKPGTAAKFVGHVRINGNLVVWGSKSGYVADFAVNAGEEPLSAGDVVTVVGATDPLEGNIPLARVVKATEAYQTGVIGVVDRRVLPGETLGFDDEPIGGAEHLSVVTHGMFHTVKVDASSAAIHAGDLLVASPNAGRAMKAKSRGQALGAVIGKALGDLEEGTGAVPIMVTLQ